MLSAHISAVFFLHITLMANGTPGMSPNPAWTGFLFGLFGGVAASSLLIGLVLGYSVAGGMGPGFAARPSVIADKGDTPTPPTVPDAPAANKDLPPVTDKDHIRGNKDAKVTIVEYSDFECPFCMRHTPTLKQVLETYKR